MLLQRLSRALSCTSFKRQTPRENESIISRVLSTKLGFQINDGHSCVITDTPFKQRIKTNSVVPRRVPDSMGTLFITKHTGHFACTDSGLTGNWDELVNHLSSNESTLLEHVPIEVKDTDLPNKRLSSYNKLLTKFNSEYQSYKFLSQIEKNKIARNFGFENMIRPSMLIRHNVRVSSDLKKIVFPWFHDVGDFRTTASSDPPKMLGFRVHTKDEDSSGVNITTETFYEEEHIGFFGIHRTRNNQTPTVIVSNEIEALIVQSNTKYQALAIPMTELYLNQTVNQLLPPTFVPLLERFQKLILWISVYSPGNMSRMKRLTHELVRELNPERTHQIVYNPIKPETLAPSYAGKECDRILTENISTSSSLNLSDTRVLSYMDLELKVKDEVTNPDKYNGVKYDHPSLKKLNKIMLGFRQGELTVLTGPTGAGKTTFLAHYSLVLAMFSDITTLWGSFEVKPERLLARTLLPQFNSLRTHVVGTKQHTNFSAVPIYFPPTYRNDNVSQFIDMLNRSILQSNCKHIIIDNLQFLIGGTREDRFMLQDRFVVELRRLASDKNIHITLVCHPRKYQTDMPIAMDQIYGGVRLVQEADNVMILQKYGADGMNRNYIDIVKNRYAGTIGSVPLTFNPESKLYNNDNTVEDIDTLFEDVPVERYSI